MEVDNEEIFFQKKSIKGKEKYLGLSRASYCILIFVLNVLFYASLSGVILFCYLLNYDEAILFHWKLYGLIVSSVGCVIILVIFLFFATYSKYKHNKYQLKYMEEYRTRSQVGKSNQNIRRKPYSTYSPQYCIPTVSLSQEPTMFMLTSSHNPSLTNSTIHPVKSKHPNNSMMMRHPNPRSFLVRNTPTSSSGSPSLIEVSYLNMTQPDQEIKKERRLMFKGNKINPI